jgi:hypothetical protein
MEGGEGSKNGLEGASTSRKNPPGLIYLIASLADETEQTSQVQVLLAFI